MREKISKHLSAVFENNSMEVGKSELSVEVDYRLYDCENKEKAKQIEDIFEEFSRKLKSVITK